MKKIELVLITCCLILTGCSISHKDKEPQEKTPDGVHYNHQMVDKMAFLEQEDGWYYYISIQYNKLDMKSEQIEGNYEKIPNYVSFDGINLIHKEIDGSYVPIIDKDSEEELGRGKTIMPSLSTLQTVAKEVIGISDYFRLKKFDTPISLSDLEELVCPSFNKQMLVTLYNQALENTPESFGRFALIASSNLCQVQDVEGRTWQGGYKMNYGHIEIIQFECIKEDQSISTSVQNETATDVERKLQENLDQMEASILDNQIFSIENITWLHPDVMDDTVIQSMQALLKKLYTGALDA